MFDYNCDITNNEDCFATTKFASSINICADLTQNCAHCIKAALNLAKEREIALGALVRCENTEISKDELCALIEFQIAALIGYASSMSLQVENVRFTGVLADKLNSDLDFAREAVGIVKNINPWLNLIVKNYDFFEILQKEMDAKCALEADFGEKTSIREIRELSHLPQTLHFETLTDIKRAYDVIKPSPISYNRVYEVL